MPIIKKGDKFNRLTAIKFSCKRKSNQYWLFKCNCGNEKIISVNSVKRGMTKSCGCLQIEKATKHGMFGTGIYFCWQAMKQRCLNKNHTYYKDYGGRGITVCKEWLKLEDFLADMGDRPENKTIDRIDNNKGYYKENCKWSTQKEQQNNTRKNVWITYNAKTQTVAQWAEELDINSKTLYNRLCRGWSIKKVLQV